MQPIRDSHLNLRGFGEGARDNRAWKDFSPDPAVSQACPSIGSSLCSTARRV